MHGRDQDRRLVRTHGTHSPPRPPALVTAHQTHLRWLGASSRARCARLSLQRVRRKALVRLCHQPWASYVDSWLHFVGGKEVRVDRPPVQPPATPSSRANTPVWRVSSTRRTRRHTAAETLRARAMSASAPRAQRSVQVSPRARSSARTRGDGPHRRVRGRGSWRCAALYTGG